MDDELKAQEALVKLARLKLSQFQPRLEEQGERMLRKGGISRDVAGKVAGSAKLLHDISKGQFEQDFGNLEVKAKMTPEERMLRLKYKFGF